jgi:hypothetical protein
MKIQPLEWAVMMYANEFTITWHLCTVIMENSAPVLNNYQALWATVNPVLGIGYL